MEETKQLNYILNATISHIYLCTELKLQNRPLAYFVWNMMLV